MAKQVKTTDRSAKNEPQDLKAYKKYVAQQLEILKPILAAAAVGDFSKDIKIADIQDEFTDLQVGIQLMIEFIREQTAELTDLTVKLEDSLAKRTSSLVKQRAIFSSIGDCVVVTDLHTNVQSINKAAENLIKLPREEIIGKPWHSVVTIVNEGGETINSSKAPLEKAIRKGHKVSSQKYQYILKGGKTLPVSLTATPVKINGDIVGAVKVFRDISAEKAIEQAKSDFVALASHQLRTPLSITKWYSQLLKRSGLELTNKQAGYLNEIQESNRRMISLVNSLLSVSQIESGTLVVDPKLINLGKLVQQVCDQLSVQFERNNVKLKIKNLAKKTKIKVDPELTKIVLHNLISNAAKYTGPGGRVSVSVSRVRAGHNVGGQELKKDSLVLTVADTGRGIPKGEQEQIFERFYKASNVKKLGIEGSGLGLYISKYVISKSKGQIWFNSKINNGTKFFVALPLNKGA